MQFLICVDSALWAEIIPINSLLVGTFAYTSPLTINPFGGQTGFGEGVTRTFFLVDFFGTFFVAVGLGVAFTVGDVVALTVGVDVGADVGAEVGVAVSAAATPACSGAEIEKKRAVTSAMCLIEK